MKKPAALFVLVLNFLLSCCAVSQWTVFNLPYNGLSYRLDFANINSGISCGHTVDNFNGKIFYTANSGLNWNVASFPPELRAFTGAQFINSSLVYAWGAQNGFTPYAAPDGIFSFNNFLRSNSLIKGLSSKWEYYKGVLVKSTNSGASWSKVGNLDSLSGYVEDMQFFDANTGYAVIDTNPSGYPKFCKTTNGGVNWQKIYQLDSNFITEKIFFLNPNTGFFCGYQSNTPSFNAYIYKTSNAGVNWTYNRFNYTENILEISFFNSNTGVAIGSYFLGTKIFRTTNSGSSWDSVCSCPGYFPEFIKTLSGTGISFASGYLASDTMTAFTKTGTFKSTDYGITWIFKSFTTNKLIVGAKLIDQNNFFMCGGDISAPAVIMKSTNGGNVFITKISSEIPESAALHQNYPNPFNSSSVISYEIPRSAFVRLVVYDNRGCEIAVLVSDYQSPGKYQAAFDGSAFSSGIYFCNLSCAEFSDTKKMLMIK